jgi:alkylhydroperoxidase family enzyme
VALDFAELFVTDHESIDDQRFDELRSEFSDDEIVDLCICVARFLAFGRITRVLRLDHDCPIGA